MQLGEILIIIVCGIIGYAIVWYAMGLFKRKKSGDAGSEGAENDSAVSSNGSLDCYKVLGVLPDASADEMRRAYYKKLMQYHPDRVETLGSELKQLAETRTKELNRAYEIAREARRCYGTYRPKLKLARRSGAPS
jgi:hypothetical protein